MVDTGEADLLPSPRAVGLPRGVHSQLILLEVDQGDGQLGVVTDVVVKKLGGLVHSDVEASVSDFADIRVVGTGDKLLEVCVVM